MNYRQLLQQMISLTLVTLFLVGCIAPIGVPTSEASSAASAQVPSAVTPTREPPTATPTLLPPTPTFTPTLIPTFTPTFTPEPTSTATPLPSVTPTSIPTDTPATPLDLSHPSVANTQTVDFIGKKFELKFKDTEQPVQIYEYYLPNETPSDWIELVEFQIYPVHPDGNEPIDFAKRIAAAFMQQYPDMEVALFSDNNTGEALLDFFYPTSTRQEEGKDFLEFNAFKFFRDAGSPQVMSFHYAKNIEGISASRTFSDVVDDIQKTREEVVSAMAEFPLFRQ